MKKTFVPALLAVLFVGFTMLGIYDGAWLLFYSFRGLGFIVAQFKDEPLKPPKAPTWKRTEPATAGRHVSDIPLGRKDVGMIALGIDNAGDYAPLIMQAQGAVRSAGVHDGKWIPIQVDANGFVICSPEVMKLLFKTLKPGERIIIQGPPKPKGLRVKP